MSGNGAMGRLPKWARNRIEDQDRKIAELTRQVNLLSEGPADSDVIQHDYVYPPRPLGRGVIIRFLMADGEYIEVQHGKNGYLELRGSSGNWASSALTVQGPVINALRVRLTEVW